MGKKIASLYAEITANTSGLINGARTSKTVLGGLAGTLKSVISQVTGFDLATMGAATAVTSIIRTLRQATEETIAYAKVVRDTSRLTGDSAENTSRVIQAADDLMITQEQLNTAMLAASRQGIDVSLDGLKKLSDHYLSLAPGVERADWLLKTFGRSGATMGAMMEIGADGIDRMTAAIEDNMIMTREAIIQSRQYEITIDNLGDTWQGVKFSAGKTIIPVLTDMLTLQKEILEQPGGKTILQSLVPGLGGVAGQLGRVIGLWQRLNEIGQERKDRELVDMAETYGETSDSGVRLYQIQRQINEANNNVAASIGKVGTRYKTARKNALDYAQAGRNVANQQEQARSAFQDLLSAQDDLTKSQDDWKQDTGAKVADLLGRGLYEGSTRYAQGLSIVDSVMGTNLGTAHANQMAMEKLAASYSNGSINAEQFKEGLQGIKDAQLPQTSAAFDAATNSAMGFYSILSAIGQIDGVSVQATFSGVIAQQKGISKAAIGSAASGAKSGYTDYGINIGEQTGGSFVVPPGFANDSYRVGVSSGERVDVYRPGQARKGTGEGTVIIRNYGTIIYQNPQEQRRKALEALI